MQKYTVIIEKGANNYSAASPDVPGCAATGRTVEETLRQMKEALEFHLEDEDEFPEAKGIAQHIAEGVFDDGIAEEYFITEVAIDLPQHA